MSDSRPVILFDQAVKEFRLGKSQYPTLKEWLLQGKPGGGRKRFRALDGVSFQVRQGEVVGLIGENGSGKSTILKLIAGITAPTSGRVEVQGRVSSLLEVGTGFHPEMTGRENIFLSGALLGIPAETIRASFDDIVRFADLEAFIDTPVKHYSSGMYMRLGFSIATRIDPDILLIDEVLAVGDEIFQKKCKDVIRHLADRGKTLIFVSHDLAAVSEICTRCLLLEHGHVVADGLPREAIHEYERRIFDRKYAESAYRQPWFTRAGTMEARVLEVRMLDREGKPSRHFRTGQPVTFECEYECKRKIDNAGFGLSIARDDSVVFGTTTYQCQAPVPPLEAGRGVFRLSFPSLDLMPGVYFVTVNIFPSDDFEVFQKLKFHHKIFDLQAKLHPFQLEGAPPFHQLEGLAALDHRWEIPGFPPKVILCSDQTNTG